MAENPSELSCALSGWLVLSGLQYTFAWGDYVNFETKPAAGQMGLSNTMKIGSQEITSPPPPAGSTPSGGYHVVAVDRYDLSVIRNEFYATGDPANATFAHQAMAELLSWALGYPNVLVLVASVGNPAAAAGGGVLSPEGMNTLLPLIDRLGGTGDVFSRAAGGTYSLVGLARR